MNEVADVFGSNVSDELFVGGRIGDLTRGLIGQWLLIAPRSNPAMLEMFSDRDEPPYRNMVPWAGEFAGKYLTSCVEVLRLTGDDSLRRWIAKFVRRLLTLQGEDGYLGPWPRDAALTNYSQHHDGLTWDTWGHYHAMTGLLEWHAVSGDEASMRAVCGIADLICDRYLDSGVRLVDTGSTEMNLAPAHVLARLHRATGEQRYLDMALEIVDEFAAVGTDGPLAGDYLESALAGRALYEMPKPRWESLHPIMTFAELYRITRENRYLQALEQIWWSIVEFDRHNNGGFSAGEKATGNPYATGAIETCCTIAWLALSVEVLELTGNSIVADEIELSTVNSGVGMHSPSGRWATYSTPEDGVRSASAHSIVFQARPGSPELNCCSVNSPRSIGLISRWAYMLSTSSDAIVVNYYGPSSYRTRLADGTRFGITQRTDYPVTGRVELSLDLEKPVETEILLRIPHWSATTRVVVRTDGEEGDEKLDEVKSGSYCSIRRTWRSGDSITIDLDMSVRVWTGERDADGLVSIYRGPTLLAFDQRYNRHMNREPEHATECARVPDEPSIDARAFLEVPPIDLDALEMTGLRGIGTTDVGANSGDAGADAGADARADASSADPNSADPKSVDENSSEPMVDEWFRPWMLFEATSTDGPGRESTIRLCDFASAGVTGTLYRSWLPAAPIPEPAPFSRDNPSRTRPTGGSAFSADT